MYKYQIFNDIRGQYRWRLISPNGKSIACSGEGFLTKPAALISLKLVSSVAPYAIIEDKTQFSRSLR